MVTNEERISRLGIKSYQSLFGVKKEVCDIMLSILKENEVFSADGKGRPSKLSVLDKLVITLDYYKSYRPYDRIAFDYGVSKASIYNAVAWVESVLIEDPRFQLPGKKVLRETEFDVILVDCTESPIQRPKKNKKDTIPGNKNDIP